MALFDYPKLEARSIQAIEQVFQQLPAKGRVDQTVGLLISVAKNTENWIHTIRAKILRRALTSAFQKQILLRLVTAGILEKNWQRNYFFATFLTTRFRFTRIYSSSADRPSLRNISMRSGVQRTAAYLACGRRERPQCCLK